MTKVDFEKFKNVKSRCNDLTAYLKLSDNPDVVYTRILEGLKNDLNEFMQSDDLPQLLEATYQAYTPAEKAYFEGLHKAVNEDLNRPLNEREYLNSDAFRVILNDLNEEAQDSINSDYYLFFYPDNEHNHNLDNVLNQLIVDYKKTTKNTFEVTPTLHKSLSNQSLTLTFEEVKDILDNIQEQSYYSLLEEYGDTYSMADNLMLQEETDVDLVNTITQYADDSRVVAEVLFNMGYKPYKNLSTLKVTLEKDEVREMLDYINSAQIDEKDFALMLGEWGASVAADAYGDEAIAVADFLTDKLMEENTSDIELIQDIINQCGEARLVNHALTTVGYNTYEVTNNYQQEKEGVSQSPPTLKKSIVATEFLFEQLATDIAGHVVRYNQAGSNLWYTIDPGVKVVLHSATAYPDYPHNPYLTFKHDDVDFEPTIEPIKLNPVADLERKINNGLHIIQKEHDLSNSPAIFSPKFVENFVDTFSNYLAETRVEAVLPDSRLNIGVKFNPNIDCAYLNLDESQPDGSLIKPETLAKRFSKAANSIDVDALFNRTWKPGYPGYPADLRNTLETEKENWEKFSETLGQAYGYDPKEPTRELVKDKDISVVFFDEPDQGMQI